VPVQLTRRFRDGDESRDAVAFFHRAGLRRETILRSLVRDKLRLKFPEMAASR
jgi:hypothetical protein